VVAQFCSQGLAKVKLVYAKNAKWVLSGPHQFQKFCSAKYWNLLPEPIAMSHQNLTYTELRKQIHDDLRIQNPEWVEPNGECPVCDSYEARLIELFDTFTRTGSDESVADIHRVLEQELN
jgi:hypothetical protein